LVAAGAAALWHWRWVAPSGGSTAELRRLPRGVVRAGLNLVVITLDTTRADHLGAYGSKDVETPALDGLAREGVLFEQAMTTAPLTLPAHASIFTGKFPPEHGVRDNGGFFLGEDQTTLAEVLGRHGYRTGGFVGAFVLDRKWGIAQGFDTYFDDFDRVGGRGRSLDEVQRPAGEVVDRALPWIDQVKEQRFFAWLHFYDPHTPYAPPEPFRSRYEGHPYRGEVAFTDSQVGRVVQFLESRGLLDSTVIVVMGDHGESLGEHGEDTHGFFIYEVATRVPLILRLPFDGARGRRIADPVRAVDVMPTVLDLLGAPAPQGTAGASLTSLISGERQELSLEGYAEAMYPLHHYGWSDLRALRAGRFKLIDAPRPELYDLELDPSEGTNIFDQRRALGDRMIQQLRQKSEGFAQVKAAPPEADVDPEVRARLAALGYVGSFVASASDPRTDRADPKDKVGLFNLLGEARERGHGPGSFERGVALLGQVTEADPAVIDAWFMLGNLHYREKRFKEAIGYYRRALELKPDYDLAVINIANAYRQLGDDAAAVAGYEHYLTLDPKDAFVRYQIGEIYLDRGETAKAEQVFVDALAIDSRVAPAKNALGVIAFQRGETDRAETLIREAIALRSDVRLARYNLALIAEQRGDPRTAEREYLEELKLHPDSFKAAFNLSRLYEASGNRALQMDALRQSIDGNPRFAEGHVFLAKALLDAGDPAKFDEAISLARKGIELKPRPEVAPLGHYVLADLYNRRGRTQEAASEVARGRALEARTRAAR
jgi:arylsulfatase A-like enzyme/Flp pilus assembly protein TadD